MRTRHVHVDLAYCNYIIYKYYIYDVSFRAAAYEMYVQRQPSFEIIFVTAFMRQYSILLWWF